jgi:hypothetical protein
MGAVGVKCGDTVGGTAGASEMPNCSGMASGMAEATGIVEDCAEMAEWSWMPYGIAEAIGIYEAVEMNEAIVTPGSCWVVGAIGLADASGMLGSISIPSTKNNWNTGETMLSSKLFNHQTISHFFTCNILVKNRKKVATIFVENSHALRHFT